MKTQLIIILALVVTTAQAQKMDSKDVPVAVKSGFQKSYTAVKEAKWDKEGDNFEASFKQKGKEMSVVLDASGNIIETEVEIAKSELPAAVLEVLKKEYAGFDIEEVAKITANGVVTYEAEVEKGKETFELIFDQQGKVLKKELEKEEGEDKD